MLILLAMSNHAISSKIIGWLVEGDGEESITPDPKKTSLAGETRKVQWFPRSSVTLRHQRKEREGLGKPSLKMK